MAITNSAFNCHALITKTNYTSSFLMMGYFSSIGACAFVCQKFNVNMILTLILVLVRYGHLSVVQLLVEGHYCKPDATDNRGQTALHFAAW